VYFFKAQNMPLQRCNSTSSPNVSLFVYVLLQDMMHFYDAFENTTSLLL